MKAMALDIGSKRIGVAVTDPMQIICEPLCVIKRGNLAKDISEVLRLIKENEVQLLIVGLPLNDEGKPDKNAGGILLLKERIESALKKASLEIPVEFVDETMTTFSAHEALKEAGVKHSQRKEKIDMYAAAQILKGWMESK